MKALKLSRVPLVFAACLLLLTGCWDQREIEDRTVVAAIAMDYTKKKQLLVSVQIPIPLQIAGSGGQGGGGGGGGGGSSFRVISASGRSFNEAVEKIQFRVNHELFFGQTSIIAFGERVARGGVQDTIDALRRMPQFRRLIYPVVVEEGAASDLLNVNTQLEKVPADFMTTMIQNGIGMGIYPNLTLGQFYVGLSNTSRQPAMLTVAQANDEGIKVTGLAAFKGDRMVGTLNNEQMSNYLRLSKRAGGGTFTFSIEGRKRLATVRPALERTTYDFKMEDGRVTIKIDVIMDAILTESNFPIDLENPETQNQVTESIESQLEKKSMQTFRLLQKNQTDILNIGAYVRAYHPEIWNRVDWNNAFARAKVDIDYQVNLRRSGMELKNYNTNK
ncbi:MAG TPA: Ger(x)C family spore germination protein [Bacillales bacterium]|nr:Ger(x)C family spore germination protein [Bacillales bacterium]